MSLVLQHRTEGLCRSQGIPARLPEAATPATSRAVVAARNVAHHVGRFQFGQSIEESDAELVIEWDFHRPVLIQQLATLHRFSKSLLRSEEHTSELQDFALVGACCRDGAGF